MIICVSQSFVYSTCNFPTNSLNLLSFCSGIAYILSVFQLIFPGCQITCLDGCFSIMLASESLSHWFLFSLRIFPMNNRCCSLFSSLSELIELGINLHAMKRNYYRYTTIAAILTQTIIQMSKKLDHK